MDIPKFVMTVIRRLHNKNFQAYIVGGAIRDSLLNRPVMDWDVVTSATPKEIRSLFRDIRNFTLKHDTVTLVDAGSLYEITTTRGSGNFPHGIEEDLAHRDFTLNAMAYNVLGEVVMDPYGGREDIHRKMVRAVGRPEERFREDPLRLLRAVRIATELGFIIEDRTMEEICDMSEQLAFVARERIRDELMKILMSRKPSRGFNLLKKSGLLKKFIPELLEGFLKRQDSHHRYTIYRHVMETVDKVETDPVLRVTALFHDIAKPRVRKKINGQFQFKGHAEASALLAGKIMERLRFSNAVINDVTKIIALHLVEYDRKWSDGAVRRLMRRVGPNMMDKFLLFRKADLLAHGYIDERINLLSELKKRVDKLSEEPIARNIVDLAVNGEKVMDILEISPGPYVGSVLEMLMEKITDRPDLNTEESLVSILKEIKDKKIESNTH